MVICPHPSPLGDFLEHAPETFPYPQHPSAAFILLDIKHKPNTLGNAICNAGHFGHSMTESFAYVAADGRGYQDGWEEISKMTVDTQMERTFYKSIWEDTTFY